MNTFAMLFTVIVGALILLFAWARAGAAGAAGKYLSPLVHLCARKLRPVLLTLTRCHNQVWLSHIWVIFSSWVRADP